MIISISHTLHETRTSNQSPILFTLTRKHQNQKENKFLQKSWLNIVILKVCLFGNNHLKGIEKPCTLARHLEREQQINKTLALAYEVFVLNSCISDRMDLARKSRQHTKFERQLDQVLIIRHRKQESSRDC